MELPRDVHRSHDAMASLTPVTNSTAHTAHRSAGQTWEEVEGKQQAKTHSDKLTHHINSFCCYIICGFRGACFKVGQLPIPNSKVPKYMNSMLAHAKACSLPLCQPGLVRNSSTMHPLLMHFSLSGSFNHIRSDTPVVLFIPSCENQ